MKNYKRLLNAAGFICFCLSVFQALIGFFPSLSLYFGAPEVLVEKYSALLLVSFLVSGLLALSGLFALSGAGTIQKLPVLKQALVLISLVFVVRGLLIVPEILLAAGLIDISIPVAMRFVVFSGVSLMIGLMFITGTVGRWHLFSTQNRR